MNLVPGVTLVKSMMMSARSAGPSNRVFEAVLPVKVTGAMRKPPSVPIWTIGGPTVGLV